MSDNQEFEHYKFIADKGQNPLRIDRFLLNFIEFATRNKLQQSIKAGNVRVNDKIVKAKWPTSKPILAKRDRKWKTFEYFKKNYKSF